MYLILSVNCRYYFWRKKTKPWYLWGLMAICVSGKVICLSKFQKHIVIWMTIKMLLWMQVHTYWHIEAIWCSTSGRSIYTQRHACTECDCSYAAGAWMESVPASCTANMLLSRLALILPSGHWPEFGLVDQHVSCSCHHMHIMCFWYPSMTTSDCLGFRTFVNSLVLFLTLTLHAGWCQEHNSCHSWWRRLCQGMGHF